MTIGSVTVQVYLLRQGKVYQEYYSNLSFSGPPMATCLVNGLNFADNNLSNFCISSTTTYFGTKIIAALLSPISGAVTFSMSADDYMSITIDDSSGITNNWSGSGNTIWSFIINFIANKYYFVYASYLQDYGPFSFNLNWAYSGGGNTQISNSKIYLQTLVGSSPYTINVLSSIWGDGYRTGTEACDDKIISNGDGWSSSCAIETGWTWSGGSISSKDTCTEIWGDGIKFNSISTYWDDGNTSSGDGCSSTWSVESGWNWSGGNSSTKDICVEICGDGKKFNNNSIYWDDSNTTNGDGWSSSCQTESGWKWSGGSSTMKDIWVEIWGDGKKFNSSPTYWDDGNTASGDGCSSICSIESGWSWSGGSITTKDICIEICGDGIRFNTNSTYWDDGNKNNGDGCNSIWSIEVGWSCLGGTTSNKDICTEIWGDGIKFNLSESYCDDGNKISGDGWSSLWSIESGYKWTGGSIKQKNKKKNIFNFINILFIQ